MNDDEFYAKIKQIYHPKKNQFSTIDMPDIRYMAISGKGDPTNPEFKESMQWLSTLTLLLAPIAKKHLGTNFAFPPFECLIWSDNSLDFSLVAKKDWQWTTMIVLAEWMSEDLFKDFVRQAEIKKGEKAPNALKIIELQEKLCVQYLHVGDYGEVPSICKELYQRYLPKNNLQPRGKYHEVYLNDPNKTEPSKRKVIIRQPVDSC